MWYSIQDVKGKVSTPLTSLIYWIDSIQILPQPWC